MADEVVKTVENVDSLFESIIINGEEHVSESYVAPVTTKSVSTKQTVQTTVEQEETEESEPSTVEKVVPNIDINFLQIIVNGEEHTSENYVAPVTTKKTVVKSSSATSTPTSSESSGTRQITGDDVYAVLLNDVLHNFVDRAVTESLAEEVQERERVDGILSEHITDLQSDVTNLGTDVGNIEALIPSQATDENQLADKDFVNSSIATNTANFLGTYTSLADITAIPNPTNNDYAFLQTVDIAGNTIYQRYKYSAQTSSWLFEYELNNSGFTAEQWATINSGLTQSLVNTAITNAINALDVSSKGGSGKYIESISQVDGAIVPVEATIADEVTIGNIHSVSSDAVAQAIASGIESYYTETCSAVQGTSASNITWHCIKTRGGLKICSGRATSVRTGTQYPSGYIYYASGTDEIWKYPSNFFTATPMCIMRIAGATKWMWALNQKSGSETQTDKVCPACPATFSNETIYYNILAIGI